VRAILLLLVDGVIVGDNPEQGVTRGSTFLHPPLRFRIDFPATWEIANSPQQVVAKAPDAEVFMLLQAVSKPQRQTARDVALSHMQAAGFRSQSGDRTTINGLDAFVGVYHGQIEGLGEVTSRAGHIAQGRSGGAIRPSTLAVMNHTLPDAVPRAGTRIKIVVAG
jgi:hypothetical protein